MVMRFWRATKLNPLPISRRKCWSLSITACSSWFSVIRSNATKIKYGTPSRIFVQQQELKISETLSRKSQTTQKIPHKTSAYSQDYQQKILYQKGVLQNTVIR
ncbi:hypothetical protein A2310_00020 [candidate division WOR-1 bacterium RIFOXYB2_FULL_37_13]|uniref:Uncharacterized protein n=1 Tax=candidate division WOR-1 bacterium RIFOXYB2_FULL_37_13 TaxID=1802579 RepID=A0A1F4SX79_UNCSA|nr:MAG: hypothetical protein A2310_00020 [candidate division WOR-1 bacterium RIFOXYB2_FULL_37_13]